MGHDCGFASGTLGFSRCHYARIDDEFAFGWEIEFFRGRDSRIVAEELARRQWTQNDLAARQKSHPAKLALAARLRQETTLSVKQIAERLYLGKPKGARTNLHKFMNTSPTDSPQIQLEI